MRHVRRWPGLLVRTVGEVLHFFVGRVFPTHDRLCEWVRGIRVPSEHLQREWGHNVVIVHFLPRGLHGPRWFHVFDLVRSVDVPYRRLSSRG